jgi:hypothetical protein
MLTIHYTGLNKIWEIKVPAKIHNYSVRASGIVFMREKIKSVCVELILNSFSIIFCLNTIPNSRWVFTFSAWGALKGIIKMLLFFPYSVSMYSMDIDHIILIGEQGTKSFIKHFFESIFDIFFKLKYPPSIQQNCAHQFSTHQWVKNKRLDFLRNEKFSNFELFVQ